MCFYFHMLKFPLYLLYLWIYLCSHLTPISTTSIILCLFNFVLGTYHASVDQILASLFFFMNVHVRHLFSEVPAQSMKLNPFDWRLPGLDLPPHRVLSCFSVFLFSVLDCYKGAVYKWLSCVWEIKLIKECLKV